MLKEQTSHRITDLLLTASAFGAAFLVNSLQWGAVPFPENNYQMAFLLLATLVCCGLSYDFFGLYDRHGRLSFDRIFLNVGKGVLAGSCAVVFLLYMLGKTEGSQFLMLLFVAFAILFLTAFRASIHLRARQGRSRREILVIGSRERARELVRYVAANEELGYHLIGCLDVDIEPLGTEVAEGVSVIGLMTDFQRILLHQPVDEVVFAIPLKRVDGVLDYIAFAEEQGVNVRILPDWQLPEMMYRPTIGSVFIEPFVGIPTLALSSVPRKRLSLVVKDVFDRVFAFGALVGLFPLFALLAFVIRIDSRGPIFFRQERSGLNGRTFTLYKFRTMVPEAEALKATLAGANEMDGPVFKIENDPRITRVGHLLRKTSLDELPQFINVLRGEMSLVGPRPPLPSEVREYQHWQRRRLSMKPGLTCIWQVSGRNKISFEEWMRMDLEYIDRWSLLLDFKLLFKTLPAVINGSGE